MTWRDRISVDPFVCHGQACVSGMRVTASVVLNNLAQGVVKAVLIRSYPSIKAEGVDAYAAALAREPILPLSPKEGSASC